MKVKEFKEELFNVIKNHELSDDDDDDIEYQYTTILINSLAIAADKKIKNSLFGNNFGNKLKISKDLSPLFEIIYFKKYLDVDLEEVDMECGVDGCDQITECVFQYKEELFKLNSIYNSWGDNDSAKIVRVEKKEITIVDYIEIEN